MDPLTESKMGRVDTLLRVADEWIASYHKDMTQEPAWTNSSDSFRGNYESHSSGKLDTIPSQEQDLSI